MNRSLTLPQTFLPDRLVTALGAEGPRQLARAVAFRALQAALVPLGAVGYVLFAAKALAYSRKTGASATVLASLYSRYMQHELGTREDEPCARLMHVLPNVPPLGLSLVTAPTRLSHWLTGYVPPIYRYPYPGQPPLRHQPAARTTFHDAALARHIPDIVQLVILGAGFDTRALRLSADSAIVRFEVDRATTQAHKREMLAKAGIDATRVRFVAADFLRDDWFERLCEAGFDPDRPSLFIWESVTMYLDRPAVEGTLRTIARVAPGSAVAFDYFSAELIESRSLIMRYARAAVRAAGEPLRFGIDNTPPVRQRISEFLAACGLELDEQRNFGSESSRRRAPAGFAIGRVPARRV